ncbi:hypothetical protein, conserved [Entamoeba dispar SAW760]|uniref:small monomeric GTPase n=1 Tax=Entamoeba dispar (strain ATCC PRA-260 / SAW760) TaxID=370354 RepID=B0EUR7_ENTDS|nr:uncharacterized protein EDI_161560 [Entamoeba dispar SAW760]EDR21711.1 hypothetical protein, conserved [Entamoeba dispar SAW760]|eukprot:EDR21711.1 hypothetical protein, conserved [Entamoeba dispar SAW760]
MSSTTKRISVVLLGDHGVGKSSVATRFATNVFMSDYSIHSKQIQVSRVSVDGTDYDIGVIDTNATMTTQNDDLITKGDAFIVMYSVTNKDSFLHLPLYLNRIYELRKDHSKSIPIIIVGNKCDEKRREVVYESGQLFSDSISCLFMETSALDYTNINHLFDIIVREWISFHPEENNASCVVV